MVLYQHGQDFTIRVGHEDLMMSTAHESERELARLGCARIGGRPSPSVLVGGLGMGYTLRQTLDMLPPHSTVVVSELLSEVVRWNHAYLGGLTGHPLRDPRVAVRIGDVADVIRESPATFDAVLLDVDNGPNAVTDVRNDRLYSREGIQSCIRSLRPTGSLAVWSATFDAPFEDRLRNEKLHIRCFRVPAHPGGNAYHCCIWLASRDRLALPCSASAPDARRAIP